MHVIMNEPALMKKKNQHCDHQKKLPMSVTSHRCQVFLLRCHMAHWYRKTLSDIVAKKKHFKRSPKLILELDILKARHILS